MLLAVAVTVLAQFALAPSGSAYRQLHGRTALRWWHWGLTAGVLGLGYAALRTSRLLLR
jgi:hypothetical protein